MLFPFALCPLSFNINTLPRRKLLPSCSRDPWAPARWVFVSSLFFWYCWQIWWTLLFSPQCELEAQGEREDPSLSCASTCCSTPGEAQGLQFMPVIPVHKPRLSALLKDDAPRNCVSFLLPVCVYVHSCANLWVCMFNNIFFWPSGDCIYVFLFSHFLFFFFLFSLAIQALGGV